MNNFSIKTHSGHLAISPKSIGMHVCLYSEHIIKHYNTEIFKCSNATKQPL